MTTDGKNTINSGLLTGFWKKSQIARDFGGKCGRKTPIVGDYAIF